KTSSRLDPNEKKTWFMLGQAFSKTGRYGEAVDAYSKCLELAPDAVDALVYRSQNYLFLGNFGREAAMDAQRWLTLYTWRSQAAPYVAITAILGLRQAGSDSDALALTDQALK